MSTLPQESTIQQSLGDNTTIVYNFPFFIFTSTDITVYVTPAGQAANPQTDIQILGTNYSVTINPTTFPGQAQNGYVTFTVAPGSNDVVTLVSTVQAEYDFDFTQAQTINGGNLNSAYERLTVVCQELLTFFNTRALQYVVNSFLPASNPPSIGQSNQLPSLFVNSQGQPTSNQVWISQGNAIVAAQISSESSSTLAAQLAVEQPSNADGTNLIGYFNIYDNTAGTLNEFLNSYLPTLIAAKSSTTANFTPSFHASAVDFGSITQVGIGEYTQIGNLVTFGVQITVSALTVGSASGNLVISVPGLPTASNTHSGSCQFAIAASNLTFTGQISGELASGSLVINSFSSGNPSTILAYTALANNTVVNITGSYFTA